MGSSGAEHEFIPFTINEGEFHGLFVFLPLPRTPNPHFSLSRSEQETPERKQEYFFFFYRQGEKRSEAAEILKNSQRSFNIYTPQGLLSSVSCLLAMSNISGAEVGSFFSSSRNTAAAAAADHKNSSGNNPRLLVSASSAITNGSSANPPPPPPPSANKKKRNLPGTPGSLISSFSGKTIYEIDLGKDKRLLLLGFVHLSASSLLRVYIQACMCKYVLYMLLEPHKNQLCRQFDG